MRFFTWRKTRHNKCIDLGDGSMLHTQACKEHNNG